MHVSKYVIEKNVPLPPLGRPRGRTGKCKYPLFTMEVGDSFFVGGRKAQTFSAYVRVTVKRNGLESKFSCAVEGNGVRVWRVK